ncbi:MAG: hypothetical protein IJW62_01975 [Clostridia bacterium]|nr:hypothetical protein [Clostridia bacterium]
MKLTERILIFLLAGTIALTMLTACDGNGKSDPDDTEGKSSQITSTIAKPQEEEPEAHTHAPGGWQIDGANHWRLCACGEVMDKAIHTVKDNACTGCEAEVVDWEDGTMSIWQCDEQGYAVLKLDYDAEGNLILKETGDIIYNEDGQILSELYTQYPGGEYPASSRRTEYSYYDDGDVHWEKRSANGMPFWDTEYAENSAGERYVVKEITYRMDGVKQITKYDENAEIVSQIWYDVNGVKIENSSKFDKEVCKVLFGTWKSELDFARILSLTMIEEEMVLPADRIPPCFVDITVVFREDGSFLSTGKIDREQLRSSMVELSVEMIYLSAEMEGLTREEADEQFRAMTGMSIREMVESEADEGAEELYNTINEESEGVYYIEDRKLYMADDWNEVVEGGRFNCSGNTFTLTVPDNELGIKMDFEFNKVAE